MAATKQKRNSVNVDLLNKNKLQLVNASTNVFSSKPKIPIDVFGEDTSSNDSSINGIENEETNGNEHTPNNKITIPDKNNVTEGDAPNRKASKSIIPSSSPSLIDKEKEDKLDQIVRNSIINFQRPSGNLGLNKIKNFESRTVGLQRRSTVMY